MDNTIRVLQVNIDDAGGAFSLMFQIQKRIKNDVTFDYYSMANFTKQNIVEQIEEMGGRIREARIRSNRLIGHIILPFDFYKFLKENDYSIVHIHSDTAWKLLLYAIPSKIKKTEKIIVHAHSSNVNGDFRLLKYICHCMARPLLPLFATDLFTCSDRVTKWMFPQKVHVKVRKIHNGVDLKKFAYNCSARERVRNELKIQENEVLIGTVGDFSYTKNPHFLVEVYKRLINRDKSYPSSDHKLVFVGEGNERKHVEDYVNSIGLSGRIVFYGKANNIEELYSAMDVFAMPSRFEGLPMSAIEAQASGLNCILSDNITREVKCIDSCAFLNILDANAWIDMIERFKPDPRRETSWEKVKNAGYDIENSAKEMLLAYRE